MPPPQRILASVASSIIHTHTHTHNPTHRPSPLLSPLTTLYSSSPTNLSIPRFNTQGLNGVGLRWNLRNRQLASVANRPAAKSKHFLARIASDSSQGSNTSSGISERIQKRSLSFAKSATSPSREATYLFAMNVSCTQATAMSRAARHITPLKPPSRHLSRIHPQRQSQSRWKLHDISPHQ